MQPFAELAAESFAQEVCLNWRLVSTRHAIAKFDAGTVRVEVSVEQREPEGPWHVGFQVTEGEATERTTMAFRVFNGVFQAVQEFIETRAPEQLILAAKNEDLASIYATYLRRESGNIEQLGYMLEGPVRVDPYTEFMLRRARPSSWRV